MSKTTFCPGGYFVNILHDDFSVKTNFLQDEKVTMSQPQAKNDKAYIYKLEKEVVIIS